MEERTRPDGMYRDRAVENLEITRKFIESYLDHFHRRENPQVELDRNIQSFLNILHIRLNEAIGEIQEIEGRTQLETFYRDAALLALKSILRLYSGAASIPCESKEKQKLLIRLPLGRDIMPSIKKIDAVTPALCMPSEVFGETGRWVNEDLASNRSSDDIDEALHEAMLSHIKAKRFMPAFQIEEIIRSGEPIMQSYNKEKTAFVAKLQETNQRVTHAMTLNALQQSEASAMQRFIETMLTSLKGTYSIGHPQGDQAAYPDFPHALIALRFNVLTPLEKRLNEAANVLERELKDYEEQHGPQVAEDARRIRAIVADKNAANLRAAYDAMVMLKQQKGLPKRLGPVEDVATAYDKFMQAVYADVPNRKIPLESVSLRLSKLPAGDDPGWLKDLDENARSEAVGLISAWTDLFDNRKLDSDIAPLTKVCQMLGIGQPPSLYPEHGRPGRARFYLNERSFTLPTGTDEDVFIPPVLGPGHRISRDSRSTADRRKAISCTSCRR